jgi:acetate kinase
MTQAIIVVNTGSSTIKAALFTLRQVKEKKDRQPLISGKLEWGKNTHKLTWSNGQEVVLYKTKPISVIKNFFSRLCDSESEVLIFGHRVVHGGKKFYQPTFLSNVVRHQLENLAPLAPLHNPSAIEAIKICEKLYPNVPQALIFDTSFHHTIPNYLKTYPIPSAWRKMGIERFGFHGINHEWCMKQTMELLSLKKKSRIITCHLGAGVSFTAIKKGKSFYNTMGFTPLEGAMMATRSGSIDPGILFYLQKEKKISSSVLEMALQKQSGLLGIAGSMDMREILRKRKKEFSAKLAYKMFVSSCVREIGALVSLLNGVDILVFTGGIGENASSVRTEIIRHFTYLGALLDSKKNRAVKKDGLISQNSSKVKILVIQANEEWVIASDCLKLIHKKT